MTSAISLFKHKHSIFNFTNHNFDPNNNNYNSHNNNHNNHNNNNHNNDNNKKYNNNNNNETTLMSCDLIEINLVSGKCRIFNFLKSEWNVFLIFE